eukprot:gnl/Dysnectes_brevis/5238_a7443_433.p1 GENE.gnl/Dysnectes_brevis/5238_a7443_433~~gnl/Dysnectes_brevis/5238_a7443_433.p1  ORF type:complete len:321 (+),score=83.79 gnl/Dysnectes_brevis/5238_a7443_433:1125-2087(+)
MGASLSLKQTFGSTPPDESCATLKNATNTCFLNGLLQAMYWSIPFRKHFITTLYHTLPPNAARRMSLPPSPTPTLPSTSDPVISELASLFVRMLQSPTLSAQSMSTQGIASALWRHGGFEARQQHDSQEAFMFLTQRMGPQLARPFTGEMTATTQCLGCGTARRRSTPFLDLQLPVTASSVAECLRLTMRPEYRRADSRPWCPVCQAKEEARTDKAITVLPEIMVLHLTRFTGYPPRKLHNVVSVPLAMESPGAYRLLSAVVHLGGADYGHYVALARCAGRWLLMDDTRASVVDDEQFQELAAGGGVATAYMLFYKRIDT